MTSSVQGIHTVEVDRGQRLAWIERRAGAREGLMGSLHSSAVVALPKKREEVSAEDKARARRRVRYERRQRSREMLIRAARREAGLPAWSEGGVRATVIDETTGEVLPNPEWVRPPRPARCNWRVDADVSVWHDEEKGAHWQGIERCGSIWACPCCAAVVRAEYAQEIQAGVDQWIAQGGGLMFVTLTIRHRAGQPLEQGLNAVVGGFRRIQQGQTWTNFKSDQGIVGSVRSVEVTYGDNGWHPHVHALFFLDKSVNKADEIIWKGKLTERWQKAVQDLGAMMPSDFRGVDVRVADKEGTVVGQYLAKVQEKDVRRYAIGMELARGDMKQGRVGSVTPMELLDLDYLEEEKEGDGMVAARWTEYFRATKGRHAVRWTKGMRSRLGLENEQPRTPEEVLADRERAENLALVIPGDEYDEVRNNPARLCLILEEVEDGNLDAVAELVHGGVNAKLPDNAVVPSQWLFENTYEAGEYVADQQPVGGDPVRRPRAVWLTDSSPERLRGLYVFPDRLVLGPEQPRLV